MRKLPRVVFIDVFIRSISPLRFAVLPSPKNNPQLPTTQTSDPDLPNIEFKNEGHNGFEIHFELQGDTMGHFFPAVPTDAIWSQRGTKCPNVTGVWDVFKPIDVVSSGNPPERRTLIVENRNPSMGNGKGQGRFQYNLRVTNGSKTLNLDPGGTNQNGGVRGISYAAVGTVSGGVAALGAAILVSQGLIPAALLSYGLSGAVVGLIVGLLLGRF